MHAELVTFGTGGNAFTMDFVFVGDAGNADDTAGQPNPAGGVSYNYAIGKYEVRQSFINKYNSEFGTSNSLEISLLTGATGVGDDKAAAGVSWNEAARFVNWLNTSQGYQPAYKFTTNGVNDNIDLWTSEDAGYDSTNPYRNSLAKYVLPSMDEWYKAAYYDPATSTYRDYASADGTLPTAVKSGTDPNTAVYNQSSSTGPADHNQAGGLNAFGVMGMSGNLWEWEETSLDLSNSSPGLRRALNGGSFSVDADGISSSSRGNHDSTHEAATTFGFRVATLLTHNPTEILLNHTTLRINTGALTVDAENIVLQGQESVVITSGSDQVIASDFSGTGHLRKLGAAQLTLSGDYATLGVIYVRSGILNIAGTASGNIVTESDANGFGTLVGTGTITGDVTASGNSVIAPGGSAGILSTGNLDLQSGANLQLELGGSTAGNSASSHDQVVVTGQVQLAGDLELSLINNFTPGIGDVLLLISNDGTDAISGTFAGLVEGDQFAAQGISWKISYVGG
ncbi:MAG: formylglycine-generating enzyme family protein, partial [Planctomycetaceae bacterium]